jgi:OmpR family response regulator RpaB
LVPSNEKILVVDTEARICSILETRLTRLGYQVIIEANGEDALVVFKTKQPHLVILDVMLPKIDGFQICKEMRANSTVPIIILTSLGNISDRIKGLELGADDYVVKPFSPKELEARILSLFRRVKFFPSSHAQQQPNINIENLTIDTIKRQVFKDFERIKLTSIEFSLLELLIEKAGEKLSRTVILNTLWGYIPKRELDTRIVDVHISRLRSKLENDSRYPDFILTVRGVGYMFQKYPKA